MDVIQLVADCRAGDSVAIERLVACYQGLVYRLAFSILDDPAEADAAVQEAFIAALDGLDAYRGDATFQTWLFSIAINVCRGRLRKRQTRRRMLGAVQRLFRLAGASTAHPEEQLIAYENHARLRAAVHALPDDYRLAIILRYGHELRVADIAEVMGVTERTVYNRLRAAHEQLYEALKER